MPLRQHHGHPRLSHREELYSRRHRRPRRPPHAGGILRFALVRGVAVSHARLPVRFGVSRGQRGRPFMDHARLLRPALGERSCRLRYCICRPPSHARLCVDRRLFVFQCYVDPSTCARESEERVLRSGYFDFDSGVDLFYSYSTCNSTADDWIAVEGDVVGGGLNGGNTQH